MNKKTIKQRIKYIQDEFKKGLSSIWNAVTELHKIEKEESWKEMKGFENSTFKRFIASNFIFSEYQFRTWYELTKEFKKEDFDTFGPKILSQIKKTKQPKTTLKKLKADVKKSKVVSMKSLKQIIEKEKKGKKNLKNPINSTFKNKLSKEIEIWIDEGLITKYQGIELFKFYDIKMRKAS